MSTFERNVRGLLGTKLGMTQTWDENNRVVPVTVVAAGTNVVTQVRQPDDRRLQRRPDRLRRDRGPQGDQAAGRPLRRRPASPRAATCWRSAPPTPRRTPSARSSAAELFAAGDEVDVTGTSKGKGFAGVMKRHGFHGVGASHGAHRNHRKPGSIGACATPGRVFKGMRMAGRMGGDTVTTQNVTVHAVDAEKGLILLKGAVPGPKGGLVVLRSAAKARADARRSTIMHRRPPRHRSAGRPPGRDLRRPGQHPADPPGRRRPAGRRPPGHPRHQDAAARSAAVAASPTSRRAPAAPARARSARRSSPAVASCTARRRAATTSARPRR